MARVERAPSLVMLARFVCLTCIIPAVGLALTLDVAAGKSASSMITAEMRQNAQQNVERYEWAASRKQSLKRQVAPYMEIDRARLWRLLPSQEVGRARRPASVHSTTSPHDIGCPQCYLNEGEDVGLTSYRTQILDRPWQVQCERCETWYPKNDFAAYYESALDETGRFQSGRGDPAHLEPREDVEGEAREWVEDGTGIEYDGYKWFFVGVFADSTWRELADIANKLATLYTLTEEPAYARRAAIILDRMAEFYPEMDERPSRELGMRTSYGPGRVMGRGWEYSAIRRPVSKAYDYIYDAIQQDEELIDFVDRMSREHGGPDKSSFEAFDAHLRENLLVEFCEDIIEHREGLGRGRAQTALAVAAAALDDPELTPRYFDWMLEEDGGELPYTLVEHMQRDGFNVNSGMGYMTTTGEVMYRVAEVLHTSEASDLDLYTQYPNLISAFTMRSRVRVLEKVNPSVGDGGSPMGLGWGRYPTDMLLDGFRRFPSEHIAREIVRNRPDDWRERLLRADIYAEDPEAMIATIEAHLPDEPEPHPSYNSGGTGFAALHAPWRERERAAGLWYGRTMAPSHAHADRLTLHLWGFDETLMPDMGYPEHTGNWPKRHGFTRHTISHNTLMINDTRQGTSYAGKTRLFADAGPVRVVDVDGLGVPDDRRWDEPIYDGVDTYRRAVVMVDVDEHDSYLLDVFWARGGENHRLIQNAASSEATYEGLEMVAQDGGTFAGENVEFGEFYDHDDDRNWGYAGTGFQFLKNVERAESPPEAFRIDWPIDDYRHDDDWRAHMRLHNLTQVDEVALAHGEPPQRAGRYRPNLRYSLRSRLGSNLRSQFLSVIEPYMHDPFIEGTRVLKRVEREGEPFAAAVEVTLADGRRDVLLIREEPGIFAVDDYQLDGRLGVIRYDAGGEREQVIAVAAREVRAGDQVAEAAPITGQLVAYDDADPLNVKLQLNADRALSEDVVGEYVIIDNKEIADGSYRIEAVEDEYTVNIGRAPLYERLKDPDDYDAGVIYNIEPGESFIIAETAVWERQ